VSNDVQFSIELKDALLKELLVPMQKALHQPANSRATHLSKETTESPSSTLIAPLNRNSSWKHDEITLLNVAETLSHIAATDPGRKFILRGQNWWNKEYGDGVSWPGVVGSDQRAGKREPERLPMLGVAAIFVKKKLNEIRDAMQVLKHEHEQLISSASSAAASDVEDSSKSATGPIKSDEISRLNLMTGYINISLKILGSFIFFLRQLYRTSEGLLWLQEHELHLALAENMKLFDSESPYANLSGGHSGAHSNERPKVPAAAMSGVKEALQRGVGGDGVSNADQSAAGSISNPLFEYASFEEWKVICIDNLLNFAGTPKGVLLLQQSGAMEECMKYMFHRYVNAQTRSNRSLYVFQYEAMILFIYICTIS
ncbi:hypothetical protein HK102_006330, partial [Quaeritorhiza haematococci]